MSKRKTHKKVVNKDVKPNVLSENNGVGDIINHVTEATGIKKVVKKLFGDDCGCDDRLKLINESLPIRIKAKRCLDKTMYNTYKNYYDTRTLNTWNDTEEINMLVTLYAHVFAIQYQVADLCRSCDGTARILKTISDRLDEVYLSYESEN